MQFTFSHTVKMRSEDFPLMCCFRALTFLANGQGPRGFASVKGTTKEKWEQDKEYEFRFKDKETKDNFLKDIERLFPKDLYSLV